MSQETLDQRLAELIKRLAEKEPSDALTDADINNEVQHLRTRLRYESLAEGYETKYRCKFEEFRQLVLSGEPSEEQEKDYFDWELAVTGIEDMKSWDTQVVGPTSSDDEWRDAYTDYLIDKYS